MRGNINHLIWNTVHELDNKKERLVNSYKLFGDSIKYIFQDGSVERQSKYFKIKSYTNKGTAYLKLTFEEFAKYRQLLDTIKRYYSNFAFSPVIYRGLPWNVWRYKKATIKPDAPFHVIGKLRGLREILKQWGNNIDAMSSHNAFTNQIMNYLIPSVGVIEYHKKLQHSTDRGNKKNLRLSDEKIFYTLYQVAIDRNHLVILFKETKVKAGTRVMKRNDTDDFWIEETIEEAKPSKKRSPRKSKTEAK